MKHEFVYHAFATGVAGRVTHPFEHLIEAQAPSALPPMGGYSSNRVEHFRFKEILSFRAAYTQVAGAFVDKHGRQSWDTVMTSTVEGLNIMGIVTADRIVARLASRHDVHEPEPRILPLGSYIEGLRIAGIPVGIEWDVDRYCQLDTHTKVVADTRPADGNGAVPERAGCIPASLVRKLTASAGCLETRGDAIYVPLFGKVVIGQILIEGNARQLTMLQVYPECAVALACTAGSGQTNGQPVPPIPKQP